MAQTEIGSPKRAVERNLALTAQIMRYFLDQPQVFNLLPDDFELVILPDDDPEMRLYNLALLDKHGNEGKTIVFARTRSHQVDASSHRNPSIFVPVAV